ncbi:MAG TPA: DUF6325 family protein [Thermoleophilaceae bacterium]
MAVGPLEYAVVEFEGNNFTGEIASAIGELVERNVVRVVDMVFVQKDEDGSVIALEVEDLDADVAAGYRSIGQDLVKVLNEDDVNIISDGLVPGSSVLLVVWENVWAARLSHAVRAANGRVLLQERVPEEVVQDALEAATARS